MSEQDRAKYNVICLEQLRHELEQMPENQFEKYRAGQLGWVEIELARAKIIAEGR